MINTKIEGREIVIRIPFDTLKTAWDLGPQLGDYPRCEVSDVDTFAKVVCDYLQYEDEDGSTVIHAALDSAMRDAVEDGCDGVEENDSDE